MNPKHIENKHLNVAKLQLNNPEAFAVNFISKVLKVVS